MSYPTARARDARTLLGMPRVKLASLADSLIEAKNRDPVRVGIVVSGAYRLDDILLITDVMTDGPCP